MQQALKTLSTVPIVALKDRRSFNKAIRTAKRIASGKRAGAACAACKKNRARCDDTRPCKRCRSLDICDGCDVPQSTKELSIESPAIQMRTVPTLDTCTGVKLEGPRPAQQSNVIDNSPQVCLNFDIDVMRRKLTDRLFEQAASFLSSALCVAPVLKACDFPRMFVADSAGTALNPSMLDACLFLERQQIQQAQHQLLQLLRQNQIQQQQYRLSTALTGLLLGQQCVPSAPPLTTASGCQAAAWPLARF